MRIGSGQLVDRRSNRIRNELREQRVRIQSSSMGLGLKRLPDARMNPQIELHRRVGQRGWPTHSATSNAFGHAVDDRSRTELFPRDTPDLEEFSASTIP